MRSGWKKHGMSGTPEHMAWVNMRRRCRNPSHPRYPLYGGRGIKVCARWKSFVNFLKDMGKRPSPKYTLDRINNDWGYEPGNCRWATWTQQANNRRKYRGFIEFDGRIQTQKAWRKELHLSWQFLHKQLTAGKSYTEIFRDRIKNGLRRNSGIQVACAGEVHSVNGWSKRLKIGRDQIRDRHEKGIPYEQVIAYFISQKQMAA